MKKLIIIIIVVLVSIIVLLFALPVVFKSRMVEAVKSAINQQVNANVEFANLKISLFRNFPKATLVLEQVAVTGKDDFAGDTLFSAASVSASMNLFSVLKSSGRGIEKIVIDQPLLNLLVNSSEKANWDITFPENQGGVVTENTTAVPEKPFEIRLEKIVINDGRLVYKDVPAELNLGLNGINLSLDGKMYGTETTLNVAGKAGDFRVEYDSVQYISNVALETKTVLAVDYETMKIAITENELLVNRLPLQLNGTIERPTDSQMYNLQFATKSSDFENFLALVPAEYTSYLENLKTSGSANISGSFKGLLFEENYPEIMMKIQVENGTVQYKDFQEKIEKISGLIALEKPQGTLDLTELNISGLHAEIKHNPIDFALKMKQLMTDPQFEGSLVGKINFTDIKEVLKADSMNLAGLIDANLRFNGVYSDVEKGSYEKIKAEGTVNMYDFVYSSTDLSQEVKVETGKLEFSPVAIQLKQLDMKVGESDFSLNGQVKDYLNYFFSKGVLKGDLQLQSDFVNVQQLMQLQNEPVAKPGVKQPEKQEANQVAGTSSTTKTLAFDVPSNISFNFRSAIQRAVFDNLEMKDINGLITVADGKLSLSGLAMKTLGGDLKVTGSYKNTQQNQPLFDFTFDISQFDIPSTFRTFSGIQQFAPVLGQSEGRLSTALKMSGQLRPDLKMISSSVNGNATISTFGLKIVESQVFKELKSVINPSLLQNVAIDDFKSLVTVVDGNIDLKPFKTRVAGQETTVVATLSAEEILNMKMNFIINREAFGQDIKNILSAIPGNDKIQQLPAGVMLTGPVGKPEVKLDLTETRDVVTKAAKGEIQNSLNKLGKGLKDLLGK